MEFKEGAILYTEDFEFGKKGAVKKKNKYLIVLLELEGSRLLFSLPSSQIYISKEKQKAGCINHKDMGISIFCFEQGSVIGQDGFSFNKRQSYCPRRQPLFSRGPGRYDLRVAACQSLSYRVKYEYKAGTPFSRIHKNPIFG